MSNIHEITSHLHTRAAGEEDVFSFQVTVDDVVVVLQEQEEMFRILCKCFDEKSTSVCWGDCRGR